MLLLLLPCIACSVGRIGGVDSVRTAVVSSAVDSTETSTGLIGPVESTGLANPIESIDAA